MIGYCHVPSHGRLMPNGRCGACSMRGEYAPLRPDELDPPAPVVRAVRSLVRVCEGCGQETEPGFPCWCERWERRAG